MKKENIIVQMDSQKLKALKRYMAKKEVDIQSELAEYLNVMYQKYVPSQVREFIDEDTQELSPPQKMKTKNPL